MATWKKLLIQQKKFKILKIKNKPYLQFCQKVHFELATPYNFVINNNNFNSLKDIILT